MTTYDLFSLGNPLVKRRDDVPLQVVVLLDVHQNPHH